MIYQCVVCAIVHFTIQKAGSTVCTNTCPEFRIRKGKGGVIGWALRSVSMQPPIFVVFCLGNNHSKEGEGEKRAPFLFFSSRPPSRSRTKWHRSGRESNWTEVRPFSPYYYSYTGQTGNVRGRGGIQQYIAFLLQKVIKTMKNK